MNNEACVRGERWSAVLRRSVVILALIALPPFFLLAILPMLLMLLPVAVIGIPFIASGLLSGSLSEQQQPRHRAVVRFTVRAAGSPT